MGLTLHQLQITGRVFDASGIENPEEYYFEEKNEIWYPSRKIKEKSFVEELGELDMSKDQHLMSVRKHKELLGHIEISNGKIVTSGKIGEGSYDNFVQLIYALQGYGIEIDNFYF